MANNQLIRKKVAEKLSYHRMQHTLGVEMVAMQLAKLHGVAEDKACTAALLHDYAKQLSGEELLEKAKAEHAARVGDGYVCPIPAGVKPRPMGAKK